MRQSNWDISLSAWLSLVAARDWQERTPAEFRVGENIFILKIDSVAPDPPRTRKGDPRSPNICATSPLRVDDGRKRWVDGRWDAREYINLGKRISFPVNLPQVSNLEPQLKRSSQIAAEENIRNSVSEKERKKCNFDWKCFKIESFFLLDTISLEKNVESILQTCTHISKTNGFWKVTCTDCHLRNN